MYQEPPPGNRLSNEPNMTVAAIIITYHCGTRLIHTLPAIASQVDTVYIIDNGSDDTTVSSLKSLSSEKIHIIFNSENVGLAAAQNQGIVRALSTDHEWILLLDDDSLPAVDMVKKLLEKATPKTAILAPRIIEQNIPIPAQYLSPGFANIFFSRHCLNPHETWPHAAIVIASGSLIRGEIFRKIGLMPADFFIDYIDYDFCLRAKAAGFGILVVSDAVLHHHQGAKTTHDFLHMHLTTAHYNSFRRYHIFRNRLFIIRRFGFSFPFVAIHELIATKLDFLRILFLEPG
jgi:rhamnosyltransferase